MGTRSRWMSRPTVLYFGNEMSGASEFLDALQHSSFASGSRATRTSYPEVNRLSGPELAGRLESKRYLVLATARPDGRPHAALTSFVFHGELIWMPTETGTARLRNLRAQPAAFLVLTEGEDDEHVAVLIEGAVDIHTLDGTPRDVEDAWHKKFGHKPDWAGAWLALGPAKLFSYDARKS
jgi:general stress protein 26